MGDRLVAARVDHLEAFGAAVRPDVALGVTHGAAFILDFCIRDFCGAGRGGEEGDKQQEQGGDQGSRVHGGDHPAHRRDADATFYESGQPGNGVHELFPGAPWARTV